MKISINVLLMTLFVLGTVTTAYSAEKPNSEAAFEKQVADYIQKFPYQETYKMAMDYTKGDPAKFNTWVMGAEPALIRAGEDKVVRMNNDTYYKLAFIDLSKGPVILSSKRPSKARFNSFQLMDNRNVNFRI